MIEQLVKIGYLYQLKQSVTCFPESYYTTDKPDFYTRGYLSPGSTVLVLDKRKATIRDHIDYAIFKILHVEANKLYTMALYKYANKTAFQEYFQVISDGSKWNI